MGVVYLGQDARGGRGRGEARASGSGRAAGVSGRASLARSGRPGGYEALTRHACWTRTPTGRTPVGRHRVRRRPDAGRPRRPARPAADRPGDHGDGSKDWPTAWPASTPPAWSTETSKPSNVILAADGPKVIDFGIARAVEATGLTATGTVLGTLQWTSPEQLTGSPVTSASDTFTWGLVVASPQPAATRSGRDGPRRSPSASPTTAPDLDGLPRPLGLAVDAALDPDPPRSTVTGPPRRDAHRTRRHAGRHRPGSMRTAPTPAQGDDGGQPRRTGHLAPAGHPPGSPPSPLRAASPFLGFLGALATGAGPLVADRVAAAWDSLAAVGEVPADATAADARRDVDATEQAPSLPPHRHRRPRRNAAPAADATAGRRRRRASEQTLGIIRGGQRDQRQLPTPPPSRCRGR